MCLVLTGTSSGHRSSATQESEGDPLPRKRLRIWAFSCADNVRENSPLTLILVLGKPSQRAAVSTELGRMRASVTSLVAQWSRIHLQCRRPGFDPGVEKIPWRRKWQPTLVFMPGESYGQRSLAGCSPWGRRVGHN